MKKAGIEFIEAGEGEPVICLHGIGGGDSDARDWPPSFKSLSSALAAFIDELGFKSVHLVGQSIGGMLALEHALRRPDQTHTLCMIASTPRFGGPDASFKEAFLKARLAPLDAGQSMKDVAAAAAPRLVGAVASTACINNVENILAQVSEVSWRGILECLVTFDRIEDLHKVKQPCCVIAGSDDKNAPVKPVRKMSDETNRFIGQFLEKHPI